MVKKYKIGARADSLRHGVSPSDAERLLRHARPEVEDLGRLPAAIEIIRSVGANIPTEAEVQRFAVEAAKLVPAAPVGQNARALAGAAAAAHRRPRLSLRLAGAMAAVVVALSAFSGVAYAANGAVPGDTLYGLDRALEDVNIGDGGLAERLTEAGQMVERGREREGLTFASDELLAAASGDEGLRAAAAALRAAADRLTDYPTAATPEELRRVADRLRAMGSGESTAAELGQAVQELAGSLGPAEQPGEGTGPGETPDGSGAGSGSPNGPGATGTTGGGGSSGGGGGGPAGP